MSFIRKIYRNGRTYLAEVENKRINGKCVQRHIRYIGRQADNETILASSISNAEITSVKLYGPLVVLDYIAKKIKLDVHLGEHAKEILAMVYAHCLDYKSINEMDRWFSKTDLSFILSLEDVSEYTLLSALDFLEKNNTSNQLQKTIFEEVIKVFKIPVDGVIYDVTNTYVYGKKCPLAKLGHDKEGVRGRPLIQIGLAVTKNYGIPICHKTYNGNVHDARTFQDCITDLKDYKINHGLVIYDRGIISEKNIKDVSQLQWDTLCGIPIKGDLKKVLHKLIAKKEFVKIENRVKLNNTIFYAIKISYKIDTVKGFLLVCYNEKQKQDLRESRYDEILYAQQLKKENKSIKEGMEKYFSSKNELIEEKILEESEFDGYSCIFSTGKMEKEVMVRLYFGKDLVEKAFRSIKGITRLQPVRHWLYNRVISHVFICYLAYLLLSILQYKLKKLNISAEEALLELDSMYKVYLRDNKKNFELSRVVALTKKQENILKTIDKALLKV